MNRKTRVLCTFLAAAAALPELVTYAGYVRRGDYPGSAYQPRVDAVLRTSESALQGGPFATVPAKGKYSVAPGLINDLGVAAVVDGVTRLSGTLASTRTLGRLNLAVMSVAILVLIMAWPGSLRLALVPVFLLVPLTEPVYRSADAIALHGPLAALAIGIVAGSLRGGYGRAAAFGVVLFAAHKLRSVYGLYPMLVLSVSVVILLLRFKDVSVVKRAAFVALGFALCQTPWSVAVNRRLTDPRLVEKDALPAHATYEALISGIAWTSNPWGLKPQDPWVAAYLAERVGGEPVEIASVEGERRARLVYLGFVKERPGVLLTLYLKRVPQALADYSLFGVGGAVVWISTSVAALVLALKRRDADGTMVLLGVCGIAACLVFQIAVIDTRFIYAYPLQFVSALALATALPVLVRNASPPRPGPGAGVLI